MNKTRKKVTLYFLSLLISYISTDLFSFKNFMLNQTDYIKILNYYRLPIPTGSSNIKKAAEKILATKLCKCIKSTGYEEKKAIQVCSNSIFKSKGLTRGKFRCKPKRNVTVSKPRK